MSKPIVAVTNGPVQDQQVQCAGKHRYHSVADANKALKRPGHRMRAYRCPHCQGWHLTSRVSMDTARKRSKK